MKCMPALRCILLFALTLAPGAWSQAPVEPDTEEIAAADALPAELLKGDHYQTDPRAVNDGRYNRFTITSDFGTFSAESNNLAQIRISEVDAIARLQELNKTKAYAGGARESLLKRWRALKTLATHPVRTIKRIPRGTARYVGNYGRMLQGGRGELEEPAGKELIRFSAAKRGIASYVGADPYSSNPVLQRELKDAAWAAYGGGLTLEAALWFIPASDVTTVFDATTTTVGMAQAVESESPESLRAVNKRKLKQMEIDRGLIRRFLKHPWYSPRHETVLVESLRKMEGTADRGVFLEAALAAQSERDALYYQQMAEMLAGLHESEAPIQEIVLLGPVPAGRTAEKLIVALPLDYVRWTQAVADFARALAAAKDVRPQLQRPSEIWIAGGTSERARTALEQRTQASVQSNTKARFLFMPLTPTPGAPPADKPAAPLQSRIQNPESEIPPHPPSTVSAIR